MSDLWMWLLGLVMGAILGFACAMLMWQLGIAGECAKGGALHIDGVAYRCEVARP